jgi:transmembrane sensor
MGVDLERARRAEPAWDEVREQRVLGRVLAARKPKRARVPILIAAGAAAAILIAWLAWPASPEEARAPGGLALRDGSEITLRGARVSIVEESARSVIVEQHDGAALYAISRRPDRTFVVRADDVEVRVRGTRFWVRFDDPFVEIEVEEGRVEVARGDEAIGVLGAGDEIRTRGHVEIVREREAPPVVIEEPPPVVEAPVAIEETPRPRPAPSIEDALAAADEARRDGRLEEASRVLERAIDARPGDPRAATALFTLGRIERARGRHAAAARAFTRSLERAPHGSLAEDALAESALSWSAAGDRTRARAAAERYVAEFPEGLYAGRVRALIAE